ncbi:MAG: UvrB/UvrC motif-containing protein [Candidatus Omnitrophota bacterium]
MLCDLCVKNQATVHLTEIVDEQMSELHLCEECARKKSVQMEQQFGLSDLLAGLAEFGKPEETVESSAFKCANCGLTYNDFKRMGRLGCSECYTTFRKYLMPLLKKIHGSTQHLGKAPYKVATKTRKKVDLNQLRLQLQQAIGNEEFEEAARLRDKIRELDKNGNQ